jgi:hypothetical protein
VQEKKRRSEESVRFFFYKVRKKKLTSFSFGDMNLVSVILWMIGDKEALIIAQVTFASAGESAIAF